jgi:hypothetical protein
MKVAKVILAFSALHFVLSVGLFIARLKFLGTIETQKTVSGILADVLM